MKTPPSSPHRRLPFLDVPREDPRLRPVEERVRDSRQVYLPLPVLTAQRQAERCMDCGVPFCQSGCPLGNRIPDWNDMAKQGRWQEAYDLLRATNNFPEFTGRVCPAPCEEACVLGLVEEPVSIERIEMTIIEEAFKRGLVVPELPAVRTGKRVAVVGSGPAGLAAADQLNRAGHFVTVFEREQRIGGLMRYGIPDFKMEKWTIDRRVALLEAEGITFVTGADIGRTVPFETLDAFDATVLCIGALRPRDLEVPGRHLGGIHFAWDYLWEENERVEAGSAPEVSAAGKHVVVIGGGDTASDCIGTARRQGALSITNIHYRLAPPTEHPVEQVWPFSVPTYEVSTSHAEGCARIWSVQTTRFEGISTHVERLYTTDVVPGPVESDGRRSLQPVEGTERAWQADLVLLAIGYLGPERQKMLGGLGVDVDTRGRIRTGGGYGTSRPGVFSAGDSRRGASLIVWAISEGREAAREVDAYLMGESALPAKGAGGLYS